MNRTKRRAGLYFWFVSWTDISLGISIDVKAPHIDIHVPFGFIRAGLFQIPIKPAVNEEDVKWRRKGYLQK